LAYKFYGDLKCDRVAVVGVKARAVCGCATPSPATDRWVNRDLHFYATFITAHLLLLLLLVIMMMTVVGEASMELKTSETE